jgi:hypothetical protein
MLEVAYPHPPRLLSIALRSRPAGLPTTRLSPPQHTRPTDRAESAPHNSDNFVSTTDRWNAHAEDASQGQQIPVWRDRDGRAHLGVTAQRTTPESRWRRRGVGQTGGQPTHTVADMSDPAHAQGTPLARIPRQSSCPDTEEVTGSNQYHPPVTPLVSGPFTTVDARLALRSVDLSDKLCRPIACSRPEELVDDACPPRA